VRKWMRRITLAVASLTLILTLVAWIAGQWVTVNVRFHFGRREAYVATDMGSAVINVDRYETPLAYQLQWGVGQTSITQPLWKDIFPPFTQSVFRNQEPRRIYDTVAFPYWLIALAVLLGLVLFQWRERRRPHGYHGFPAQDLAQPQP